MKKKAKTNYKKKFSPKLKKRYLVIICAAFSVIGYFYYSPNTSAATSVIEVAIDAALRRYCVPPEEYNCNPTGLAHYDAVSDSCIPNTEGYTWDAESRTARIEVECPSGYGRYFWQIEDIMAYKCPGKGEGLQQQEYTLPQ